MKPPMPRRLSLALLVVAAALLFALPGGARPAQNTLTGTVGPGFSIALLDESGNLVTHLDPGTYTITVKDQADIHNFDLTGPGVSQHTEIEFVGTTTWTVTFADGIYTYLCDAHPTQMKGRFAVGTATLPAPKAHQEAPGRADPAREDEAGAERSDRDDRQLPAELPGEVGRLTDLLAELVDGRGELLALGLDVAPDLLGRAAVTTRHRSSARSG